MDPVIEADAAAQFRNLQKIYEASGISVGRCAG